MFGLIWEAVGCSFQWKTSDEFDSAVYGTKAVRAVCAAPEGLRGFVGGTVTQRFRAGLITVSSGLVINN